MVKGNGSALTAACSRAHEDMADALMLAIARRPTFYETRAVERQSAGVAAQSATAMRAQKA